MIRDPKEQVTAAVMTPFAALLWHLIAILPERTALRLASPFGRFFRSNTRAMTMRNMRALLGAGTRTSSEFDALWRAHATHAALTLFDLMRFDRLIEGDFSRRIILEGREHLNNALACGRGVTLFLDHCGSIAAATSILALSGYDITLAGNVLWIPFLERKIVQAHEMAGAKRILTGKDIPAEAAAVYRRNGIFATFIDFSPDRKHRAWFPFCEGELSTSLGPAIIALRNRTPVLCATAMRIPGNKHRVVIHPPIDGGLPAGVEAAAHELTSRGLQIAGRELFDHPAQWWPWDFALVRPAG